MKPAHELLRKLRAAGVEPMSTTDLKRIATDWAMNLRPNSAESIRLLTDLLEARGKLAEVREALESDLRELQPTSAAGLLEILDREPEP